MTKQLFYIGQAIICINDDFKWSRKHYPKIIAYPIFGQRYTVRDYVCVGSHPAIVLQEIRNPDVIYMNNKKVAEAGFWDQRFVGAPPPVEEKATMIRKKKKEMV